MYLPNRAHTIRRLYVRGCSDGETDGSRECCRGRTDVYAKHDGHVRARALVSCLRGSQVSGQLNVNFAAAPQLGQLETIYRGIVAREASTDSRLRLTSTCGGLYGAALPRFGTEGVAELVGRRW